MIKVTCHCCCKELEEPGALLFYPPEADGFSFKAHLCVECLGKFDEFVYKLRNSIKIKELLLNEKPTSSGGLDW